MVTSDQIERAASFTILIFALILVIGVIAKRYFGVESAAQHAQTAAGIVVVLSALGALILIRLYEPPDGLS